MKLYWKVAEAPTGRYRAFDHRSWPTAYYVTPGVRKDAEVLPPAAFLYCEDSYCPQDVRAGTHKEITIKVLHHQHPEAMGPRGSSWKVFTLKKRAATLDEAKQLVQDFLDKHPDWHPKQEQQT